MINLFIQIFILLLPFSFALNPMAGIDLPIIRLLVPGLFFFWLIFSLLSKHLYLDNRPRFFLLLVFLLWVTLSCAWALEPDRAFRKTSFLLNFLPLYFVICGQTKNILIRDKLLKTIFLSALLAAGFGLLQFTLQFIIGLTATLKLFAGTISPFFLGQTFGKMVAEFPSWLVNVGGQTIMRAFGSFPDPHLFSLYLNLCLPLGIYLFNITKRKIYLWACFVIFVASLLSFARAAYLSFIFAGLFWFLFSNVWTLVQKKPALLISGGFFILALLTTSNPISTRLWDSFNLQEGSNSGRLEMWYQAWQTTLNFPLQGVGIGNFSRYIQPDANYRVPIYAHNLFLDFSAETGFPGAIALCLLLVSPIFFFLRHRSALNFALATSSIILLVHSLFETPFYSVNVFPLIVIFLAL